MTKKELELAFKLGLKVSYEMKSYPYKMELNLGTFTSIEGCLEFCFDTGNRFNSYFPKTITKRCMTVYEYDLMNKKTVHKLSLSKMTLISTDEEIAKKKLEKFNELV